MSRSGRLGAMLFGVWLLLAALPSGAAVPVEESVGTTRMGEQRGATATYEPSRSIQSAQPVGVAQGVPYGGATVQAPTSAQAGEASVAGRPTTGSLSQNTVLFTQIQSLEQQVQELRGLVEELTHQVNKLSADQMSQYRDLDGRLVALRGAPTPGTGATGPAGAVSPAPAQPAGTQPAGEREAYAAAFELMRARKFTEATSAFGQFVRDYPNGEFTANSYYWLGELYLAQADLERARDAFAQVLTRYPDSQKVADALYKAGVVHHRLGDVPRARELLGRAVKEYPGSSAAALAETYLAELQ